MRADVAALCALPFDINDIHRIAMRDPVEFSTYWKERTSLERQLASILRRGTADGSLRKVDPRLTALTVLANDEGVQNWYRLGSRWSAAVVGANLADLTVAGLLVDPGELAGVRAASDRSA